MMSTSTHLSCGCRALQVNHQLSDGAIIALRNFKAYAFDLNDKIESSER